MQTLSGKPLSKIGIGSFGIGGKGHRNVALTELKEDSVYIDALVYTLQKGINFTEIAMGYGHGNAMKLFKEALTQSHVKREDIFFTHSLYTKDFPTIDVVYEDIGSFYTIMETQYADATLVSQSLILKFGEQTIYSILHHLLSSGKTRYVSLTNASPDFIRSFKKEFGDAMYAHEGHLSFEVRALEDKGVFKLCDKLGIKNVIWRPLRRNKTLHQKWELLEELSGKYNKTQSQIILNWMCHLGYSPMVFSLTPSHIDENIASIDFTMSDEDYQKMTDFRPPHYKAPEVHWDSASTDDDIVALVNNFDQHLEK